MARKTYTEEDRARVRQALLDTGLNMAVSKGLKGLHLAELAAAVGISKPYFYTFFDSLEDFSLQMMEEQRCRLLRLLEQELARPEGTWPGRRGPGRSTWSLFSGRSSATGKTASW